MDEYVHRVERLLVRTKSKIKQRSGSGKSKSKSKSPQRRLPPTPAPPGITFGATLPLLASIAEMTPALQRSWCFKDGVPLVVHDCVTCLTANPSRLSPFHLLS